MNINEYYFNPTSWDEEMVLNKLGYDDPFLGSRKMNLTNDRIKNTIDQLPAKRSSLANEVSHVPHAQVHTRNSRNSRNSRRENFQARMETSESDKTTVDQKKCSCDLYFGWLSDYRILLFIIFVIFVSLLFQELSMQRQRYDEICFVVYNMSKSMPNTMPNTIPSTPNNLPTNT